MRTECVNFEPDMAGWHRGLQMFSLGLRVITGGTFATSGFLKLANRDEFASAVESYDLFDASVSGLVILVLPHLEMLLGILFAFGVGTMPVSRILVFFLAAFTSIGTVAFFKGSVADCGCFPTAMSQEPIGIGFFLRNGLLALSCLWVAYWYRKATGGPPPMKTADRSDIGIRLMS